MATKNKKMAYNLDELFAEYRRYIDETGVENNINSFKAFLKKNKLSTAHAEEIYDFKTGKTKSLPVENFKMRKSHPKRDAFLKKVFVPTAVTSGGIGALVTSIAASGLPGGAKVLGMIPVSATPGLTLMSSAVVGFAAGVVLTPAIILAKNALVKAYYNATYHSAGKNLNDYTNGTRIEDLHLVNLVEKVEATSHKIFEMKQAGPVGRFFNFIPRHILNTINRNRIHHIEKCTKELYAMYQQNVSGIATAEAVENTELATTLTKTNSKIFGILKRIDSFVSSNVEESKVSGLLSCKASGAHTHSTMIENIDIFANLKIHMDAIAESRPTAEARTQTKNLRTKHNVAERILNGDRIIARMISSKSWLIGRVKTQDDVVIISSEDGTERVEIAIDKIDPSKEIEAIEPSSKGTIVHYTDGSSTLIPKIKKATIDKQIAAGTVLKFMQAGYDKKYAKLYIRDASGAQIFYATEERWNELMSTLAGSNLETFNEKNLDTVQLKLYKKIVSEIKTKRAKELAVSDPLTV